MGVAIVVPSDDVFYRLYFTAFFSGMDGGTLFPVCLSSLPLAHAGRCSLLSTHGEQAWPTSTL